MENALKHRLLLALTAVLAIAFVIAPAAVHPQRASAAVHGLSLHGLNRIQRHILSGFASFEAGIGVSSVAPKPHAGPRIPTVASKLCPHNLGMDVKVNQNCLNVTDVDLQGRGQATNETTIAQNPFNPSQLVGGFNDYIRGDGNCYGDFSSNGGASWTDTTIPMSFTRGTNFGGVARQYWQAGGDTSVAWDTRGNAYFACQVFQRGPGTTNNPDQSSAVYVFRSTGDGGASWDFPGRPAVENFTTTGSPFNDKPYMTVDNHVGSPFRDRIYVTWTVFAADGTAYIYEVHSNDYGQTFSAPVLVSTTSSSLCTNTLGLPTPQGTCNENQYSDPFTGPDGTLYVAFANFNNTVTGQDNHNQVLLTRSTDGGQTFSAPVLAGNYYDLPDCATYQGGQDAGRACVPEKLAGQNSVFRATNYPSGAVNPLNAKQVVVTFGSYINRDSNESNGCVPAGVSTTTGGNLYTGVKTIGACSNKILLSVSSDGGSTFTGSTTDPRQLPVVDTAPNQAMTDQWFQWTAFTPTGTLATSYYDRQYGRDETTGSMDVSTSVSADLANFTVMRATSSSMPLPTQFPDSLGNSVFFGDYTGLTAESGAHPLWMDTRNPDVFVCPGTAAPGTPPALCEIVDPNGILANTQRIYTADIATARLHGR
ncbi:MAG TPA: sialidase family protein [Streptosporangiaceae bacterium]|nr:sialidase family protein [Streptosporangiaceae bacterium]